MSEDNSPPEDARPPRAELWHRLISGEVTEVYVPGYAGRVDRYLPQTLGLEPIFYGPYLTDAEGAPTTNARRAEIARQLAAGSRWIAGGGPWEWDQYFANRAEVVLIFELYDAVEHRRIDNDFGIRRALAIRREARKGLPAGSEPTAQDRWRSFLAYSAKAAARGTLTAMENAVYEVRERYPEKAFIVSRAADRRLLRTVRARPAG